MTELPSVLIIGAGFGGLGAAIELRRHGFTDVTILEAAATLGGTWRDNDYPGAACDVPSALYSYSFAQRTTWSRVCAPQEEILDYLHETAEREGVADLVVPHSAVQAVEWSDEDATWTATTADGRTFTADSVILATGQLSRPRFPDLPGIDRFRGESFHSARWNHAYELAGKRVAVIGNGASAVQFVPAIAPLVASLDVYQRTGNWLLPRRNRAYSAARRRIARLPGIQGVRRAGVFAGIEQITRAVRQPRGAGLVLRTWSTAFMRWQLRGDAELRAKLWPDYTFGCKRILFTSFYVPALRRPNVELIVDRIAEITETGVRTADGTHREVDCLIHATGFHATDLMFPMQVRGAGGRDLQDDWAGGAHAHLGMTVPGYPSMFVVYGPNTNTSGGSIIVFIEAQARYIRQVLELAAARGTTVAEVRTQVERASDAALQARFAGTAWLGCDSWYRNADGRIVTNWPDYMRDYVAATDRPEPGDFTFTAPASATAGAATTREHR